MVARNVGILEALLKRLAPAIREDVSIVCKHFFSGAAAYANGQIFMTHTSVGLALKLPAETREELLARGAQPLSYFPNAPVKKDYGVLPETILEDDETLALLINESLEFVLA